MLRSKRLCHMGGGALFVIATPSVRAPTMRARAEITGALKQWTTDFKEILVWGDVPVVRLPWTLTIRQRDSGRDVTAIETGLDIFRKESGGRWRIIGYIAYEQ